jgi:hypothetical protein
VPCLRVLDGGGSPSCQCKGEREKIWAFAHRTCGRYGDGSRVPAASGRYFDTVNPATEQVIARVAEADAADIDAAVRSARAAFEGEWGQRMSGAERGHALLRFISASVLNRLRRLTRYLVSVIAAVPTTSKPPHPGRFEQSRISPTRS